MPETLYTNMSESLGLTLFAQRIWYKLPFERFTETKVLYNGSDNFQRMCQAARWTKAIDIFLEKEDIGVEERAGGAGNDDNARAGGAGNDENVGLGENVRAAGQGENVRAARPWNDEINVGEEIADDDEQCDSEGTPPNSDSEECERSYIRYEKGSGEIKLGQAFDSIIHFKEAVVEYSLKEKVNVKYSRWGPDKSEVICSLGRDCKFRIYCSIQNRVGKYVVMTCNDEHSCILNGSTKVLKDGVIAKLLLDDIRKYPSYKPKAMQELVEDRFGLVVSNDQCRKAKAKALSIIEAEHEEQFARLKDYRLELIE